MNYIQNPIIPGFNPDPSILRVGDDFYIATSTFEWFPGIQLHHSRDLVNWKLIGHGLTSTTQLPLEGVENSGGIYAPSLTYCDGEFWLAYSIVYACRGETWMSTPAYVVKSKDINGPWSEPYPIGSFGFDPSVFHDADGRKYVVHMIWDGRKHVNNFGGIVIQELNPATMELVDEPKKVFSGTHLKGTEGPQVLRKDDWYYLVVAEGGTGYGHAITVARSRSIWGPFDVHPDNPILTAYLDETSLLQRAGHGFFVETQNGEWYLSHLATRPIYPEEYQKHYIGGRFGKGFSVLGRESNLQQIEWRDDWPYVVGGKAPQIRVAAPKLPRHTWSPSPTRVNFDSGPLPTDFQTLRAPLTSDWASFKADLGKLRIVGRHFLNSNFQQSLIARRIQHFNIQAETECTFLPTLPHHMAGLIVYYSSRSYYFLQITANDDGEKQLQLVFADNGSYDEHSDVVNINNDTIYLRVNFDGYRYQFRYSEDTKHWKRIGPALSAVPISDEGADDIFRFTGPMVGMFVSDVSGQGKYADFGYFEYREI
ncbi:glycoside hydrolase family 43 protein [Vibrio sp. SCSIO 43140]|uniref:glycoside hydrolase family 43 protein n=1 Tax=Vibrio sp. SCSIO 43140 TaxID=2819100 RepID=UPI0020760EFD|nr:glycoside hydrolase family 43 protein [Vibrio sp. SCSIO 43140]USD59689.1 glycoside hydrolase family 43 protein [Vibrio sp. SCSIO 43140]